MRTECLCQICFTILNILTAFSSAFQELSHEEFEAILKKHRIIPDVLEHAPNFTLKVLFNNRPLKLGGVLTKSDCVRPPGIAYEAEEDRVYTLVMTDLDVSRPPRARGFEWQHWIHGNIPENRTLIGETITQWIGLVDEHLKYWHRYVIYLFRHESYFYMKFDEPYIGPVVDDEIRRGFNTSYFANLYHLGKPIAVNFFYAGDSTPTQPPPPTSPAPFSKTDSTTDSTLSSSSPSISSAAPSKASKKPATTRKPKITTIPPYV